MLKLKLHAQMSFSFATHSVRVVSRNVGYSTEENGSVEVKAKKLQEREGEESVQTFICLHLNHFSS